MELLLILNSLFSGKSKKNILGSGDRFQNAANAAAANVNSGNPNPGIEDFGNSVLNELRSGKIFVYPIMSTAKIIKKKTC